MITKEELIKEIDNAAVTEKNAVILYSKHLKVILAWSGVNNEKRKIINSNLDTLINESTEHIKLLDELKNKIRKDEKNVL